jgi:asparagine synthase (glutamine-hydrolysing)
MVRHYARIFDEQPRWQGSYDDAVAETRLLLQRILQDRTNRAGRVAPLVSGGLDSSLLASTYSEGGGANAVALTSVAPPGSGIADESFFADSVCSTLGLERRNVYPAFDADTYRPAVHILEGSNGPLISNRHCLTEAFQAAAREAGANLIINGTYGELSVTARLPAAGLINRLRATLSRNRRRFSPDNVGPSNGFHVRLAPHRLSQLPEDVQSALHAKQNLAVRQNNGGLFGYLRGADKALTLPNEFNAGAIRMDYPYRDLRLLRLFAGFPLKMLINGGHDRGMARALLAGRLPDSIRLRRRGMPASPDHMLRLQRQAGSARQRIAYFRKADINDWLDLDWLDSALQAVAARGPANVHEANEVQLTAMAAEFLLWWRNRF